MSIINAGNRKSQRNEPPSSSPRSRARRAPRSTAARQPVLRIVMPGLVVASEAGRPRETIAGFLRRTGWARLDPKYGWRFKKDAPTTCEINGEPVLRKQWRTTRMRAADHVTFTSWPRGGRNGTKQVVGLVAMIAIAAFAGPLGGAVANALSLPAWAGPVIGAGVGLGGDFKINMLEK